MAEENVKVAVRVRPFNDREKQANAKLCVEMSGNQTIITNQKTNEEKKFAYDFSYWSYDGFKKDATGYFLPDNPKYADQKKVFNDLGAGVLKNAWEGFNASLFAYGQTGSGKSYSVVGYGVNKGIVPLTCEDIFNKAPTIKDKTIEVTFSMLEIYSEQVRDLLSSNNTKKEGLLIREDPKIGFYPQGLTKQLVASYKDIEKLTDTGTANRTIAATNMNATSSRAHTIVTVNLVQKYKNEAGKEMAKSSLINLVDLAGSERADATGATGDRLKEGAAINLSLTSLGNVISALADNSSGKNVRVPYRDSVLTKLLMNALGGNSKTIMIAAISPADINFDESVSTLRYADRAKQIKCKAVVNEDPTEKLIADLKAENARLKEQLAGGKVIPQNGSPSANDLKKEEEAMKKQLEENEKAMKNMQQSYEEKLAAAQAGMNKTDARTEILEKAKKTPHLSNLNMDPSLSGTIKILIEGEGKKSIGLPGNSDISLSGLGILEKHGAITMQGGKFNIEKFGDAKVLKNGVAITSEAELNHLDRLVFGSSQYYVFIDPSKATPKDTIYTFEMAQNEIAKVTGIISKDTKNMSQEQIQVQGELVDLITAIDEANMISIELDKKVKYTALPVSADVRGEYDGRMEAFISVKDFSRGLEWIWKKNKFLDRKADMTEYYADFKDDGIINRNKFKNYDPFFESADTPTQIGTCIVSPKSLAYLVPIKNEFTILDLKSRHAGLLNVELVPCDAKGKELTDKDACVVQNPQAELLNKSLNFLIKISGVDQINEIYEDIYCQFQFFPDPTVYKTDVLSRKKSKTQDFTFTRQFNFPVTSEFLEFLLNKSMYIQVWGEQKNPTPDKINTQISTREYFDRERANGGRTATQTLIKTVDPEIQKLRCETDVFKTKINQYEKLIENIKRLHASSNGNPVNNQELAKLLGVVGSNNLQQAPPSLLNLYQIQQRNFYPPQQYNKFYPIQSGMLTTVYVDGERYNDNNGDGIYVGRSGACSIL